MILSFKKDLDHGTHKLKKNDNVLNTKALFTQSITMIYRVRKVEELQQLFSILRDKYPTKRVSVEYDYEHAYYLVTLVPATKDAPATDTITVPVHLSTNVVYGDTDSIFISFLYNRDDKTANRMDTFRLAELCGELLTDTIFKRPPIEMEFENVKNPLILIAKKHYIGKKFEDKKHPLKCKGYDVKGVALTKRNYCKLVKKCYQDVIDYVMEHEERAIEGMEKILSKHLQAIELYQVDFADLVITASLAKSYKTNNLPHVFLANKLKARKEEVQVGDRIPYIFVESPDPKTKKFEKAEDPVYAKENNLKFDRMSYLDQVIKPVLALLKIIMSNHQAQLHKVIATINKTIVACGGKPIKDSFEADVQALLD
jgi:DNA polymerase elongation subunit (family B)